MKKHDKTGLNQTGMQTAPGEGVRTLEFSSEQEPHPAIDHGEAQEIRARYFQEAGRVGSMPPPVTMKGLSKTVVQSIKGDPVALLLDKLGQRAAFERTGTRLYAALIGKVAALQPPKAESMLADLQMIQEEELAHFHMLVQVINDLGGDPTILTPGADVSSVASLGLLQVITDPRTTVAQSLEAIQTAELTDTVCWEALIELVDKLDQQKLLAPFQTAHAAEMRHTDTIKRWLQTCTLEQV